MPKVEEHRLVEGTEGESGAKYLQKYREGKRVETYKVEELDYADEPDDKRKQWKFELGKAFEVNLTYTFYKEADRTRFVYEGTNRGVISSVALCLN
ncbi:hypothetical protein [Halobacillus salinus]|uniref:hypothetical protein n=1 Tax=Halobacillus salinus TaxID=192814 RepID=UPI0018773AAA|nr:hypothetical protein [Halobacillus salinus]